MAWWCHGGPCSGLGGTWAPATLLGWALCWALTELFLVFLALQPFWPLGTGVARGFLAAFDAAWMVKRWAEGAGTLEVLAER